MVGVGVRGSVRAHRHILAVATQHRINRVR